MGARLLKRWLALPLKDEKRINNRLQVVEYLMQNEEFTSLIQQQISQIGDLERIISKVATGRISPRECLQLKVALQALIPIKEACKNSSDKNLKNTAKQIDVCAEISEKLDKHLDPSPPALLHKGNVIKQGVSAELDQLREISSSGKAILQQIQERERERIWERRQENCK